MNGHADATSPWERAACGYARRIAGVICRVASDPVGAWCASVDARDMAPHAPVLHAGTAFDELGDAQTWCDLWAQRIVAQYPAPHASHQCTSAARQRALRDLSDALAILRAASRIALGDAIDHAAIDICDSAAIQRVRLAWGAAVHRATEDLQTYRTTRSWSARGRMLRLRCRGVEVADDLACLALDLLGDEILRDAMGDLLAPDSEEEVE